MTTTEHSTKLKSQGHDDHSGFTVIELMVSIAIVGLLIALLTPAVQSARQASSRLTCQSRLRQLGMAASSYEEVFQVLPVANRPYRSMLPYIEQSALYQQFATTGTATNLNVETYVCPSDPQSDPSQGQISYFINDGSGWAARRPPDPNNTRFDGARPSLLSYSKLRDFTDGTSQTTLFAERKINPANEVTTTDSASIEPERFLWYLNTSFTLPAQLDLFRQECSENRAGVIPHIAGSFQFMLQQELGYNHGLTPNRPGCHNGDAETFNTIDIEFSLRPATSYHPGGVNVAFVDGHVQLVADGVDSVVWRAISTRQGAETVGDF